MLFYFFDKQPHHNYCEFIKLGNMSTNQREWIYRQMWNDNLTTDFVRGLDTFIEYACSQPNYMNGKDIKCPCITCKCKPFRNPNLVKLHLLKDGFMPRYYNWVFHGEMQQVPTTPIQLRDEILPN